MSQFPIDIARLISDYAAIWTVVPWLREIENNKPIRDCWSKNTTIYDMKCYHLSANPMACDELEGMGRITPIRLAGNNADWAFDLIESKIDHYELVADDFATNTNPRAIAFIESCIESVTPNGWNHLLMNSSAIELIKKYNGIKKASDPYAIYANPNEVTWDLVKDHHLTTDLNLMHARLSFNSAAWATRLMFEKNIERAFWGLCSHYDPKILDALLHQHGPELDSWDWRALSANPAAIHILRAYPNKIKDDIWSNPAIFELTPRPEVLDLLTQLCW